MEPEEIILDTRESHAAELLAAACLSLSQPQRDELMLGNTVEVTVPDLLSLSVVVTVDTADIVRFTPEPALPAPPAIVCLCGHEDVSHDMGLDCLAYTDGELCDCIGFWANP